MEVVTKRDVSGRLRYYRVVDGKRVRISHEEAKVVRASGKRTPAKRVSGRKASGKRPHLVRVRPRMIVLPVGRKASGRKASGRKASGRKASGRKASGRRGARQGCGRV